MSVLLKALTRDLWDGVAFGKIPNSLRQYRFAGLLLLTFIIALLPLLGVGVSAALAPVLVVLPFLLLMVRGFLGFRTLHSDLQGEIRCLKEFCQNANILWSKLRNSPAVTISQQDMYGLVSASLRSNTKHSKFLIEEIANAKLHLLDASNDTVLRQHKEELETKLRELLSYGSLSIRLGVLGTFIGFLLAIFALGNLFGGLAPSDVVASEQSNAGLNWTVWSHDIKAALHDLAFKFVASIYGLIVAMGISIQSTEIRRQMNELYRLFDEALSFGREFVNRMTLADPAIHSSLTQVRDALARNEQRMFDHGQRIEVALRTHGGLLNDEIERFSKAAQGLSDVQKQWDSAFSKFASTFETLEEGTVRVATSVESGLRNASSALSLAHNSYAAGEENFRQAVATLQSTLGESDRKWQQRHVELGAQIETNSNKQANGIASLSEYFTSLEQEAKRLSTSLTKAASSVEMSASINSETLQLLQTIYGKLIEAINSTAPTRRSRSGWGTFTVAAIILMLVALFITISVVQDPMGVMPQLKQVINALMQRLSGI